MASEPVLKSKKPEDNATKKNGAHAERPKPSKGAKGSNHSGPRQKHGKYLTQDTKKGGG